MIFCPKCGSLMGPKEEKGKRFLACSCGYTDKKTKSEVKESAEPKEQIEVVDSDQTSNPIVEEICPECGHDKAEFWTQQMRAGDEPETKFYKCRKCKKIWRSND